MSTLETQTISERKTPRKAWLILLVTYLCGFAGPLVQMKVPALASWLFPAFMLDATTFGWLMSGISIFGFILAFPAAFLIRKFGLKAMMIASMVSLAAGSAISALSGSGEVGNTTLLLVGRLVEGIGLGFVGVTGPSCISIWFPDKTRGLALGVWATWVPMGSIVAMNLSPALAIALGDWRMVFWAIVVICLIALVLFCIVFKMPEESESDTSTFEGTVSDAIAVLKNKYIWILGVVFFVFNGVLVGICSGYQNTFIETQLGFSAQAAASISSITMAFAILIAPITGAISDRLPVGKKKYLVTVGMLLLTVSMLTCFYVGEGAVGMLWAFVILSGLGGITGGACRPMAPIVMQHSAIGATMGMAVLQFTQNLGQSVYSPVFGMLLDATGDWQMSLWIVALPTMAIGIICSLFITTRKSLGEGAADAAEK